MADGVKAWSTTAATNATADSTINWAEGQAPSTVNDSARALMAGVKKWHSDFYGATTAGTSTAYTLTTNVGFDSLAEMSGNGFVVRFNATNGASPTLNVDGLGAKNIQTASGTAVATGAILANSVHYVCYDNSIPAFLLVGAYADVFGNASVTGTLGVTGVASFADGSNSDPSITNTGDTNTGVYFPAADEVGVTAGGTQRARFTAAGAIVTGAITASTSIASTTTLTAGDGFTVTTGTVTLPADSVAAAALAAPAAWVCIQTQTASNSATIDLTTGLDDTLYDAFCIVVSNAKPATDDVEMWLRIGTGAGPTYQAGASDYDWSIDTGSLSSNDVADSEINLTLVGAGNSVGNASGESFSATVYFNNPEATNIPHFHGTCAYSSAGGGTLGGSFIGGYLSATAITGVRFLFESGNIASGRFTLYGLTKTA